MEIINIYIYIIFFWSYFNLHFIMILLDYIMDFNNWTNYPQLISYYNIYAKSFTQSEGTSK